MICERMSVYEFLSGDDIRLLLQNKDVESMLKKSRGDANKRRDRRVAFRNPDRLTVRNAEIGGERVRMRTYLESDSFDRVDEENSKPKAAVISGETEAAKTKRINELYDELLAVRGSNSGIRTSNRQENYE